MECGLVGGRVDQRSDHLVPLENGPGPAVQHQQRRGVLARSPLMDEMKVLAVHGGDVLVDWFNVVSTSNQSNSSRQ
jgi:hypothetical protein